MKQRPIYMKKLIQSKDNEFVKVITGVRRSGKSSLLQLFAEHLRDSGVKEDHILEINYEKYEYKNLTQGDELHKYLIKKTVLNGKLIYL